VCAQVYGSNGLASGGGASTSPRGDPASRSTPVSREQIDEGEASGGEEPQLPMPAVEAPHDAEREALARRDIAMWAP
jgi:hypothetical protein